MKHPKFGALKLTDGERAQEKINIFNNHQLEKKLVSYVHSSEGSPARDFFKVISPFINTYLHFTYL